MNPPERVGQRCLGKFLGKWRSGLKLGGVAGCIVFGGVALGEGVPPEIRIVEPRWIRAGATTEMKLEGSGLDESGKLWASFPCEVASVAGGDSTQRRWRLTLPNRSSNGLGVIRFVSKQGVSAPKVVGWDGSELRMTQAGTNRESAPRLEMGTMVAGQFRERSMNWYQLPTEAGKAMAVEILAGRVGSGGDPFAELWDANGKRTQFQEDAPGAGVDCRWEWRANEKKARWLGVRDTGYGGGVGMDYWVRVSDRFWDGVSRFQFAPSGSAIQERPTIQEKEPNTEWEQAMDIDFDPAEVHGELQERGDVDYYRFRVKEAGTFQLRGQARELGSRADLRLRVWDSEQKPVATSGLAGAEESTVEFKAIGGGTYWVSVDDWNGEGGDGFAYRMGGGPVVPFGGVTESMTYQSTFGGGFEVKVVWNFPKEAKPVYTIRSEPPGWRVEPGEISSDQKESVLKVFPPKEIAVGELGHVRLWLSGVSGTKEERGMIRTKPALKKLWENGLFPPRAMDGWLGVGIREGSGR